MKQMDFVYRCISFVALWLTIGLVALLLTWGWGLFLEWSIGRANGLVWPVGCVTGWVWNWSTYEIGYQFFKK
jgi:hypothetical protein